MTFPGSAHPHYERWLAEQSQLIHEARRAYPGIRLDLAGSESDQTKPTLLKSQEDKSMFEQTPETAVQEIQANGAGLPKRRGKRRVDGNDEPKQRRQRKVNPLDVTAAAIAPAGDGELVSLTPEEVNKLWNAVTGGQLIISGTNGNLSIQVSLESFRKGLHALLGRL